MAHHLVCFLLCAFCIQNSLQTQTVWQPVIVSNSSLQNTTLITELANVSVDVSCSIIANRRPWASLFCMVGEYCIISSFLALPFSSKVPIADPVGCMTKMGSECLYNGVVPVKLGDWYCPTGPFDTNAPYLCVEGVLIPVFHPPSKKSCPATFKNDPNYGCLVVVKTHLPFCQARATCLKMEGDLYAFDQMTNIIEIKRFKDAIIPNGYLHAGFIKKGTDAQWVNGKSLLENSTLWHSNFRPCPFSIDPTCGKIMSNDGWASYGLGCASCKSANLEFVCRIDISN